MKLMNKIAFLILLFLSVFIPNAAFADGETHHSGNNPTMVGDYTGHVLTAMTEYYERVYNHEPYDAARSNFIAVINQYPQEVNDYVELDGVVCTPLRIAVLCNDVELVALLLEKGAFPVLPDCDEVQGLFDGEPECGGDYDIRIVRMIAAQLSKLRLYEQAQQKGFKYH